MTNPNKVAQFRDSSMSKAVLHSLHNIEQEAKRAGFGHPAYAAALLKAIKKARKAFKKAHATPELVDHLAPYLRVPERPLYPFHRPFSPAAGTLLRVRHVVRRDIVRLSLKGQKLTTKCPSRNDFCTFVPGSWEAALLRVVPSSHIKRDDDAVMVCRVDGGIFWEEYTEVWVSSSWLFKTQNTTTL